MDGVRRLSWIWGLLAFGVPSVAYIAYILFLVTNIFGAVFLEAASLHEPGIHN